MEQHETTTFVDEKVGVWAHCLTCRTDLGPMHGVPDRMGNLQALAQCFRERDAHTQR